MAEYEPNETIARRRDAAIAGHLGNVEDARTYLTDDDPKVRATALGALNRCGALSKHELLHRFVDVDPIVRRRACTEATIWDGRVGEPIDPEVADALARLLDDPDDSIVEIAAWACGERPPAARETVARLSEIATAHPDALCRESAVAALGALEDEAGLPAILQATTDKATVRRRAIIALAPFDGPEVEAAFQRALEDRDWQVRQAAEDLNP